MKSKFTTTFPIKFVLNKFLINEKLFQQYCHTFSECDFYKFFIPLTVGLKYSLDKEQSRVNSELEHFQASILNVLETGLKAALLNLEPVQVKNSAQLVVHDPRVVRITVFSDLYGMTLADVREDVSGRQVQLLSSKREIEVNGEKIGYIEIEIDKTYQDDAALDANGILSSFLRGCLYVA